MQCVTLQGPFFEPNLWLAQCTRFIKGQETSCVFCGEQNNTFSNATVGPVRKTSNKDRPDSTLATFCSVAKPALCVRCLSHAREAKGLAAWPAKRCAFIEGFELAFGLQAVFTVADDIVTHEP